MALRGEGPWHKEGRVRIGNSGAMTCKEHASIMILSCQRISGWKVEPLMSSSIKRENFHLEGSLAT